MGQAVDFTLVVFVPAHIRASTALYPGGNPEMTPKPLRRAWAVGTGDLCSTGPESLATKWASRLA